VGEAVEDLVGGLGQTNGFGSAFHASIQALTSVSRSLTLATTVTVIADAGLQQHF
jgi:hypothetical protein